MSDVSKLDMQTTNITHQNIEALAQLFPTVVTETLDEDGKPRKTIDFDLLRQQLSSGIVEWPEERYRLDRPGKRRSLLKANTPITKTLRPVKEDSVNWESTQNLYIEWDNFEVLKILQESYLGKVKMIYIDPPYNTGKDFVYRDNFRVSKDEYEEELDLTDEEGWKLVKNTDTNGRFHSDWLSMMYERLIVARDLLKDDGVIFMSIDDNEVHNLRKIADEIFGEENFIAQVIRNTNSSKNQSTFFSISHDYSIIYAKNTSVLNESMWNNKREVDKNNVDAYVKKIRELQKMWLSNDDITEELKELTKYPRFIDFTNYRYVDERGVYRKHDLWGVKNWNNTPIVNPLTGKKDPLPPWGFRYTEEKLQQLISEDRIHFHTDWSLPTVKRYLNDNLKQRPKWIMSDDQRPDYSLLKSFWLEFDNPKQLAFMKRIISILDKDALILDFFSWSATTAHAVMELNAEDWWSRQHIQVQLPEEVEEWSEAYKAGYEYITEIGKERIRRAGQKILEDHADKLAERETPLDIWFRVYRVDSSNMKDVYYHPSDVDQKNLWIFETNIKEERTPEDLLVQVMLDLSLELSLPIETKTLSWNTVFFVNNNALVACFDENINFAIIDEIAEVQPLKVVFRDSCFRDDKDKINVDNRFQRLSPETVVRVI